MKRLLTLLIVAGSAATLSACAGDGTGYQGETLTQAPYAEERTVGASQSRAPVVRSAEPVFESKQVK